MKIAHIADLHLGAKAFSRVTATGMNWREHDIIQTFREAMAQIAKWDADLLVIAGDVFDVPRPSNATLLEAYRALKDYVEGDLKREIVIVGGNHDMPRSIGQGHVLYLFRHLPRVHVMVERVEGVWVGNSLVVGVPHGIDYADKSWLRSAELTSNLGRARMYKYPTIMVVHAAIRARDGRIAYAEMARSSIPIDALSPERWTYIAAGDFHECVEIQPGAWYSGALDPFDWEIPTGGSWLAVETEGSSLVSVEKRMLPTRPVIDLPVLDAKGLEAGQIDALMEAGVGSIGGVKDKIVRQKVVNISREIAAQLHWRQIRAWKADALHFHVVMSRPEVQKLKIVVKKGGVLETVREYVESSFEPVTGVTKKEVIAEIELAMAEKEAE